MRKRIVFLLIIALAITILAEAVFIFGRMAIENDVEAILQETNQRKREELARQIATRVGPERALDLLVKAGLPYYGDTHLLAHAVGQVAYDKYGEDALFHCKEYFLNGCEHSEFPLRRLISNFKHTSASSSSRRGLN